jgi:hypothetical protein
LVQEMLPRWRSPTRLQGRCKKNDRERGHPLTLARCKALALELVLEECSYGRARRALQAFVEASWEGRARFSWPIRVREIWHAGQQHSQALGTVQAARSVGMAVRIPQPPVRT